MRKLSTRLASLPKVGGKACAQYVRSLWPARGQNSVVLHTPQTNHNVLGINEQCYPSLYTNCIQVFRVLVGNFTPVNLSFYTVYTGPTKTTTTLLNKRGI
jgi:hypothetical protein